MARARAGEVRGFGFVWGGVVKVVYIFMMCIGIIMVALGVASKHYEDAALGTVGYLFSYGALRERMKREKLLNADNRNER